MKNNLEKLKQQQLEKEKALAQEPYQVIIQPSDFPNRLRLTYSKYSGGVITLIEELDALDTVKCGCIFKGRSKSCSAGGDWIKDIRSILNQIKPRDWPHNEIYIEEFYKNH